MRLRFAARLLLAAAVLPIVAVLAASSASAATSIQPVNHVDVQRYLGTWKQIADIPQWYETFCQKNVTAQYSLNADGTVKVHNTCSGPFNAQIVTDGAAKVLDTTSNAQLQVSFLNLFGQQIFTGNTPNYVIIGLAPDYSWAVVGDPGHSSAYVLSRKVTLDAASTAAAKQALVASGYDPCKLKTTVQDGGSATAAAYC